MSSRFATLAFVLLVWLALWLIWPIDAIHFDSGRDLLMARDCYELGRCDGHGPPTSFPGLFQGVIWTNALGLLRWLGLQPAAIGGWLAALYALILAATWHRFRGPTALPLCLLLLAGFFALVPVVLWSPTLFLPAMILTTWLTLDWLERPTWPLAIGLGVLWGVTLDLYLAAGPVLLATFALGLRTRKPLQTLTLVALALAVGWLISPGAWLGTLAFIPLHPLRVVAVCLALVALVVLAMRVPKLNSVALLALAGTGAWLVVGWTHHFESRYLMPGYPALCLLVAQQLASRKRLQRAVWLSPLLAFAFIDPSRPELRYVHASALAKSMEQHHIGWPDALAHAQGALGRRLAPATAVFLPRDATLWQGEDVVVNALSTRDYPAVPSRVDLSRAQLCWHDAQGMRCEPLQIDPTPPGTVYPFAVRIYESLIREFSTDIEILTLRMPVRAGGRETLTLLPQFPGDLCPWTFADGAQVRDLPGQATEVTLERRFTRRQCPDGRASYDWLPPWQETPLAPTVARPLPPPPPKPPLHPVLSRASEPLFAQLASVVARESAQPEPDVAVERDRVRMLWPHKPPLELRPAPAPPWFHVVDPGADPTQTAAVLRALPQVFVRNPWQEADVPSVSHPVIARPRWPHLTLAGLGLLVLLGATWRVARGRPNKSEIQRQFDHRDWRGP